MDSGEDCSVQMFVWWSLTLGLTIIFSDYRLTPFFYFIPHSAVILSRIIFFIRGSKQLEDFSQFVSHISNFSHSSISNHNREFPDSPKLEKDPFQSRSDCLFFRLAGNRLTGASQFPPQPEFSHRIDEQTEYHNHRQSLNA